MSAINKPTPSHTLCARDTPIAPSPVVASKFHTLTAQSKDELSNKTQWSRDIPGPLIAQRPNRFRSPTPVR